VREFRGGGKKVFGPVSREPAFNDIFEEEEPSEESANQAQIHSAHIIEELE